jgi:hypothetical protein
MKTAKFIKMQDIITSDTDKPALISKFRGIVLATKTRISLLRAAIDLSYEMNKKEEVGNAIEN